MQCLGTSLVFIMRNTKTSSDKNPTMEMIKSELWWEAIKQLQARDGPCQFRWSNSYSSQALQWLTVTLCWITAGSTRLHQWPRKCPFSSSIFTVLWCRGARYKDGWESLERRKRKRGDWLAGSDRLESFAQWAALVSNVLTNKTFSLTAHNLEIREISPPHETS